MTRVTLDQVRNLVTTLSSLTRSQRLYVLRTMNKEQMNIMMMACYNLATKADRVSPEDMEVLGKYKRKIETIAHKGFTLQEKRYILTQRGNFVTAILPILSNFLNEL